jgi:hypothetical protein
MERLARDALERRRTRTRALPEGTPEWATVTATIISLRATCRAGFDEYLGK